jgi:hypothetical protein
MPTGLLLTPISAYLLVAAAPAAPAPGKEAPKADAWSSTRIPQSIHEISNGENILGFGANLAADHPVSSSGL